MEKELNGTESENSVESEAANSNAEEKNQNSPETDQPQEAKPEQITEEDKALEQSVSAEVPEKPEDETASEEVSKEAASSTVDAAVEVEADEPKAVETPAEEEIKPAEEQEVAEISEQKEEPAIAEPAAEDISTPQVEEPIQAESATEETSTPEVKQVASESNQSSTESDESKEVIETADDKLEATESKLEEKASEEVKASSEGLADDTVEAKSTESDELKPEENKISQPGDDQNGKKTAEDEVKEANEVAVSHQPVEDDHHHDDYANEDFTKYTKSDLVEVVKKLGKEDNPLKADRVLGIIAPLFNDIRTKEKEEASKKFVSEGGDINDFSFKPDELDLRFDANYRLIKDRRSSFIKDREQQKQSNFAKAELVLDRLREFVDSEESTESFESFKALQNEWKAIGDVPSQQSKTLWANYNALIHRFYDQRSIYFELKELDRKKNYDAKVKLCERAEELDSVKEIREAIKKLNDLHYDFKHLGPVPRDLQEDLWQRFKAASDKIYEKRKGFVAELKTELKENLGKKESLADEIQEYINFSSDQIKEWNSSSKKVLDIQKRWEAIGGLPKDKAKAINKKFWSAFKSYFHNKKQFFKKLESEREGNLELKQELVNKVEALKESTDWMKTANEIKQLQQRWREIGPVPGKVRNEIYEQFKKACDDFFDNKRKHSKESEGEYSANLKKKSEIATKIEALSKKADFDKADLQSLCDEFHGLGFVPKKSIGKIKDRFREAVDKAIEVSTTIPEEEKETLAIKLNAGDALKGGDADRFLHQKEQNLRRQIGDLENNIALWTNNLEFFRHSKNADELRDEVNAKVDKAREEVNQLKRRLKAYRKL